MSGGRLVVLDRAGRDGKRFPLAEGLATLGCDPACDIRIMLPTVSPHHATVVVHANQTVIRNVCADETLVNGRGVSVAALRHGDVISIGGRHLRWEYADPLARRPQAPEPALHLPRRKPRSGRRASGPAPPRARDPQLQLKLELEHRASMPGSAGGKQVAIVQPQRRDTGDHVGKTSPHRRPPSPAGPPPRTPQQANKRARTSKSSADTSVHDASPEKSSARLLATTQATLWIESRKPSPRRAASARKPARTPLRLAVLKRAQSAHKMLTKIEGPLRIDHTKQAAIRLMTGHTPKSKPSSPSFVVKKPSPVRRTPRSRNTRGSPSAAPGSTSATPGNTSSTPGNTSSAPGNTSATPGNTSSRRSGANRTVTILEITDSDGRNSSVRNSYASRPSTQKSPRRSGSEPSPRKSAGAPSPRKSAGVRSSRKSSGVHNPRRSSGAPSPRSGDAPSPRKSGGAPGLRRSSGAPSLRKSALKDPAAKRGARKTESIKFDLSNLESHSQDSDVVMLSDSTRASRAAGAASDDDNDVTLRYSESPSPSPRRSIHSRSSRILEHSLGSSLQLSPPARTPPSPPSPPRPRSARGSLLVQRALGSSASSAASRRAAPSPRTPRRDLESYSIVDLVSVDTDRSALSTSVYGSADSTASTAFGTPQNSTRRKTRSTIEPTLLGSSTPYVKAGRSTPRSRSDPSPLNSSKTSANDTRSTVRSSRSKRSKSLSTPENTEDAKKHISVNSTLGPRASRSRSRLHDSAPHELASPRSSKRRTGGEPAEHNGVCTPENRHSPEEASTPVLSIQSLLDSSQNSFSSQRRGRPSFNTKRKTIGGISGPKTRVGAKSKSSSFSARKTRLRLSSDSVEILNKNDDSEIVTPKSAVKLVPEGVKNKHSTAKKPQSKRSIIDDLNESDIVKQLFNSPVKRKLSQSMTEYSRRQLADEGVATRRSVVDASLLDHTDSYTPDIFVSPISTPTRSPSLEGIKLMFAKTTPENDLRDVRGVRGLLRTPRARKSIKNDLTDVCGVKQIFAKSPKNRLSDVRVKEVFVSSPKNDLRRVTGVKSLFQVARTRKSPRNELDDVRGVKKLFNTKSPANDLRNVSGVKRTLRRQSPKNDLSDVRGVKRVFRRERRNDLSDVSGVEELFNLSNHSSVTVSTRAESLFDQLVGKPQKRAVYSKTFHSKTAQKTKGPRAKSLHASLDQVTVSDNNWLEQELNKRLQIKNYLDSLKSVNTSKANRSKQNKSKSLHATLEEEADVDVSLERQQNEERHINNDSQSRRSVNVSKANKSEANKSNANKSSTNRSRVNRSKASVSKANASRELQKLATDTVEGEAPLLTSRVRNGSGAYRDCSDNSRRQSASALYGAHTLPLKKRSLADAGAGAGAGAGADAGAGAGEALLPLKKRALHSTPLKGRAHALDVSALARVSPIRAHDLTAHAAPPPHHTSNPSTPTKETAEVRPKNTRGTRANTENQETFNVLELVKPSPKKTRGRSKVASPRTKPASPAKEKALKAKKATDNKTKETSHVPEPRNAIPAKAKKASPAKAKKDSPTKARKASPAKAKKASPAKAKKASPAKTRRASPAKAKKASPAKAKKASPAKTKKASPTKAKKTSPTKAKKASPIKTKKESLAKSKAVSPVSKASSAKKPASPVPVKATRSRRNNASVLESNIKKRRASLVVAKKSPVMSPKPRATRKRKEPETTTTPVHSPKKSRATRKNTAVKDDKPKTPKSSRAKLQRATVLVAKPSPQLKPRAVRRSPADRSAHETKETTRKTRKTVTVQETQPESPKKSQAQRKSGKTQAAEVQPKTRGRKTAVSESKDTTEVGQPEPKTKRGRKTDEPAAKKTKNNAQEKSIEEAKPVKTRGKKVEPQESVESAPSTRGRRGAKPAGVAPAANTNARKRKSDSAPENELPPKLRKSKEVAARGRKRTEATADTKSTRNNSQAEEARLPRGRQAGGAAQALTELKTRGRKANIENVPANQATGKRKRAEPSPVQERITRAARGAAPPAGKAAGRSRRR